MAAMVFSVPVTSMPTTRMPVSRAPLPIRLERTPMVALSGRSLRSNDAGRGPVSLAPRAALGTDALSWGAPTALSVTLAEA